MNIHAKFAWTDDAVAEAVEMYSDGRSYGEIATFLGTSRNSVSGLVRRNPALFADRRRNPTKVSVKPKFVQTSAYDFSGYMLPDVQPISFLAIGRGECRWPLSCDDPTAGPNMPCCGAETGGMVYCPVHASISRGRGTESERTAHKAFGRAA